MSRSERGASLVEVMLVTALVVVVTTTALGTLDGLTRSTHRQEDAVAARARLRQALDEAVVALRSAGEVRPDPEAPREVVIATRPRSSGTDEVRLEARPDRGEVLRIDSRDARILLSDLVAPEVAVVRYHDASGRELDPVGAAKEVAACAASVDLTFAVRTAGGRLVAASRTVALRNRPGGGSC